MKQRLSIIIILTVIAVGTLYALDKTSNAPNQHKNGFKRMFLPIKASIVAVRKYDFSFHELSGRKGDSLFLMTGYPGEVFCISMDLKKMHSFKLEDPEIPFLVPRFYSLVEYPQITILGGNAEFMANGNLETGKTSKAKTFIPGPYGNPVKIKDRTFVMKMVDTTSLNACFVKMNDNGAVIGRGNKILLPLRDAGMIQSGMLRYDSISDKLIFMHFYDNGIDVFDTDLENNLPFHTIDTNVTQKIKVLRKGKAVSYAKAPTAVNGHCEIFDGNLYVRSKLKADNENNDQFFNNTVIDKYDLKDGKYQGSFYLPKTGSKQIGQFYFLDQNKVLAIYENSLIIYTLKTL